ncbi:small membrane protein [Klebsiella quasipneumoniae]|nr:small membrane protein [Klebsiella quasipneumoniae]
MSDLFIILCLILCPVISLWSGVSYIRERALLNKSNFC